MNKTPIAKSDRPQKNMPHVTNGDNATSSK
jgi:hypothetical protein